MKARTIVLTLALFTVAVAVNFAADNSNYGNLEAQRGEVGIFARAPKSTTVVYETAGDNVKVTTDGATGDGKPTFRVDPQVLWQGVPLSLAEPTEPRAPTRSLTRALGR